MRFCLSFAFLLLGSVASFCQTGTDAYTLGVKGVKLVDEGEYELGIKLLKQARNLEPHEYDYTFEIGKAYAKSGDFKKAEKYLFPLQYHANVQSDLYLLLSQCYAGMEELKKSPDTLRKKQLDVLRYGIQKLPTAGVLYSALGKCDLELGKPADALAVLEAGIQKAPNFAENYFWAAKLMKASGNQLWAWIYAEICFNMTDDLDLIRSSALIISESSSMVFSGNWKPEPEVVDVEIKQILTDKCTIKNSDKLSIQLDMRQCLLEKLSYSSFNISPVFKRMATLDSKGLLEAYAASIYQDSDKEVFLKWLATNGKTFEAYKNWRYWNPIALEKPMIR